MSLALSEYPHFVPKGAYLEAVDRMVCRLRQVSSAISTFQIAGVQKCDVSDIDIFVSLANDITCNFTLRGSTVKNAIS
jgi:hypothetical protein